MDHVLLYFQENEENENLLGSFYRSMKDKMHTGEITIKEIEEGLEVDLFYLEKYLGEVTSAGIDHLRCALTKILQETKEILTETAVRIVPFTEPVSFTQIRHASVGRLFSIAGIVSRIESTKPLPTSLVFLCNKCSREIDHKIEGGIFNRPSQCSDKCKSKSFSPVKESKRNSFKDYQRIKIQELFLTEVERRKAGSINCILEGNLVNTLLPGDAVHVLGTGIAEESGEDGYTVGIKANNISFLKQKDTQNQFVFLPEDIRMIKDLSETEDIGRVLSDSLFPEIIGNYTLKKGLLLSLVGGAHKKGKRKEIHTIVIGDPGMGKSKLIRKASEILPRSNYVCGATTTAGGLGLTMQTNSAGEYVLAAGALVLSDLGHCFIDELDKLDRIDVLFEAMESEEITIAKAGMVCAMPARTAVISAANPLFGKYDQTISIEENINIPKEFLSRFDIVYLMIDNPNTEEHHSITKHILGEVPDRLEGISPDRAQKYIQYAREQIHPRLSSSAKEKVSEFFKVIRKEKKYNNRVLAQPLTPRIIDSVIRIAEATAKLSLRAIATQSDVEYAIEVLTTETVTEPKRKRKKDTPYTRIVQKIKETNSSEIAEKEIERIGKEQKIEKEELFRIIYRLNENGLIIKKGGGMYSIRL